MRKIIRDFNLDRRSNDHASFSRRFNHSDDLAYVFDDQYELAVRFYELRKDISPASAAARVTTILSVSRPAAEEEIGSRRQRGVVRSAGYRRGS